MKYIFATTAAAALMSQAAFAGSPAAPAPDPIVPAPAIAPAGPDWTGFYLGGQAGYADIDTNVPGVSGDGFIGGIIAGYDYDFGNAVVGAGLDYDFSDITITPGTTVDNVFRVKLRGGYKFGDGLAYATGGYAQADTNTLGSEDGYFVGLGYEHLLTEQFSLGAEVLYHEFDNYNGTPIDVEATTVQVRGAFRF